MEDKFLDFLNSSGHPIGTYIAVIIGGVTLIFGIIMSINKLKKMYDTHIEKKVLKNEEDQNYKESIQKVVTTVSTIEMNLNNLSTLHESRQTELNTKLDDVWAAIKEGQQDSREGDIALESQIKNYESAIESLDQKISAVDEKSNLLIESDKEGIKSFITDKYYQATKEGYIPLHVLQTLELRYDKYLQENGNTYVGKLMDDLREISNDPNHRDKNK